MRAINRTTKRIAAAGAAAVVCLAAAPAGAAGPPQGWPRRALDERTGFARAVAGMPGGRDFVERLRTMGRGGACECDAITPIGDVDRDGTQDVVYSTSTYVSPYVTTFSLLDGRTGRPVASDPVKVRGFAHAVPARLGDRSLGFVYLSLDLVGGTFFVVAGAVDENGTRRWERTWEEGYPLPRVGVAAWFHDAALFEENGRTDLVVATSTSVHEGASTTVLALERLSGASGETIERDSSFVDDVYQVGLDAVEDVSATGEVDLLVQTDMSGTRGMTIELRSDVDAEPTWSFVLRPTIWGLFDPETGDVFGDERAEILLQRYRQPRLVALDGVTGERVWSVDDVLRSSTPSLDGGGTDLVFGETTSTDGHVEFRIRRTDPRRRRLWTTTVDLTARTRYRTLGAGYVWPAGDATGDGVADLAAQVMLWDDDGRDFVPIRASRQYLVDGRTGRSLGEGTGYFPLTGSFTAAGNDAVEFRREGRRLEMLVLDGGSGEPLWRSRLGRTNEWPPCSWDPRALRTASGADLLLVEVPRRHGDDELVFHGGTGELLWRI